MKWNHLPLDGGIYAQSPKLIDQFRTIFQIRAKHEEQKQKAEESKRRRESGGRSGRVAGGRSRHR